MILFAVLAAGLMMMMCMAIEGGRVFVEFRRLQAAADVAALTGAQDLPCAPSSSQCSTATQDACVYAQKNGFPCTADAANAPAATVPPVACSPYNQIDYGNGKLPSNTCAGGGTTPSSYNFIEVRLTEPIQVPIFNLSFTLYAHAVAKHGSPSPKDFAIVTLDPSASGALTLGSNGTVVGGARVALVVVGSVAANSTSSSSISQSGSATNTTCDGGWFTTSTESAPSNVVSSANGTPDFAPPTCNPLSTTPLRWTNAHPPIPDPYAESSAPPSSMTNCSQCGNTGEVYKWSGSNRSSGTWLSANNLGQLSNSANYEFFPGLYPNGISLSTGGNVYFNPGVYTITGGFTVSSTSMMCIYGAPACDNKLNTANPLNTSLNCSDAVFGSSTGNTSSDYTVTSSQWYYYCSPWGIWDTTLTGTAGSPVTSTPPTFYNSTTPLNGVTFYLTNGSNNDFKMTGSGQTYLAFPNSCAGTDTSTPSSGSTSVTFGPAPPNPQIGEPSGDPNAVYSYPTGSLPQQDGVSSSPAGQVYPNADLTLAGEVAPLGKCQSAPPAWSGEFGSNGEQQHLQFLVWERNPNSNITLAGGSGQDWWGIVYNPGNPTTFCGNSPNSCTITMTGSSGGGGNNSAPPGPPMLAGQLVGDNVAIKGNATVEVYYRPCPQTGSCDTGPGTGLVE